MTDPGPSEIRVLMASDLIDLRDDLVYAAENELRVSICWDGGLKVKVGEGMWTPPLGETR